MPRSAGNCAMHIGRQRRDLALSAHAEILRAVAVSTEDRTINRISHTCAAVTHTVSDSHYSCQ